VEYTFKHALTQEVAYNSLLQERRKVLHERTAQAIETLFHSRLEDYYSDLAHHYSRSNHTEKAVEYLHLAGQQAVQRSAYTEAISHLTAALELLQTLPDTPERARQELVLQTTVGVPLTATKGYGAPEVETVYTRARELCRRVGETSLLFPVLPGLWNFYLVRAELQTARELGEQLLTLAQSVQDPVPLLEAHGELGSTSFWLGEVTSARAHVEQSIALYDPQQHRSLAFLYGQDPKVTSLSNAALVLWFLGYPDQALKRSHDALTLAQELSHPFSLAFPLSFAAMLHQYRREGQAAQERAEATIALSTEQGFPYWLTFGTILRGWALVEQRPGEEGIAQLRQGLDAWRATGAELRRPYYLGLLAEAHEKVGQVEEGLSALAEALTAADKTGERWWEAELYRLKGELVLQSEVRSPKSQKENQKSKGKRQKKLSVTNPQSPTPNPHSEAEECFLKAIEIARKQSAKSLELRATMSLARLWQQQGKQHAARNTLSDIYNWFTEGFDTADLKDAKVLLEELGGRDTITSDKKRKRVEKGKKGKREKGGKEKHS
jgi:predicted ATPase